MTEIGTREPWWHFLCDHCVLDRLSPRPSGFVGQKGHRRGLSRTMATLTILLKNGQDILCECRIRCHQRRTKRSCNCDHDQYSKASRHDGSPSEFLTKETGKFVNNAFLSLISPIHLSSQTKTRNV